MSKAWAVYHDDFEMVAIYQAETRGKAVAAALAAARDAYPSVKWQDFVAKRAARFDALVSSGGCFALGCHARSYDLQGNFTGYDTFGCLDGEKRHPRAVYEYLAKDGAL